MLIDWEHAGPGRAFEIQVPDVIEAGSFYRKFLDARETFRQETDNGEVIRLGLAAANFEFMISSEEGTASERPLLSLLAAELGAPFVAIILRVGEPHRVAYRAVKNGCKTAAASESEHITLVTDPFGGHWAIMKREHSVQPVLSSDRHLYDGTRH